MPSIFGDLNVEKYLTLTLGYPTGGEFMIYEIGGVGNRGGRVRCAGWVFLVLFTDCCVAKEIARPPGRKRVIVQVEELFPPH